MRFALRYINMLLLLAVLPQAALHAQSIQDQNKRFRVSGGSIREVGNASDSLRMAEIINPVIRDSLAMVSQMLRNKADSLVRRADGMIAGDPNLAPTADSLRTKAALLIIRADSIQNEINSAEWIAAAGSPQSGVRASGPIPPQLAQELTERQQRKLEKQEKYSSPDFVRHSRLIRDSIPISRVTLISLAVPGFAQLYNGQPWKIPILYAAVGTSLAFGIQQNRIYSRYRREYDALIIEAGADRAGFRDRIDPIQSAMIRHNTYRQLLFGAAALSYAYFLGDGLINHPNYASNVKIATTFSMIFPGAGQIYNKSYWKVPIVWGTIAGFVYMVDWNNRGYQRFKLAYNLKSESDVTGEPSRDEFGGRYSASFLKNLKDNYRRNRDLCIIVLGAAYALNIIDAHVDAHMKTYDISDNLMVSIEPEMTNFYTMRSGNTGVTGLRVSIKF